MDRPPYGRPRDRLPAGPRDVGARGFGPDRQRRPPGAPSPGSARVWQPAGPEVPGLDPATEELVAGRRPVEEAFVARREARRLLVVPQRRQALEKLVLHATSLRIPVVEVEGGSLTALAGFDGHQGIALVVAPRRWADPDEILADARAAGEAPLVVVLDSLEDPQNVGTLLRTAEAAGAHGAIFPTRRQAPLTPAAVKASAGAVEHLRLAPVEDLPGTLADLHARGIRIVGADGDAPMTARATDLRGPLAIVVGSEGKGLTAAVRRRCDLLVRIPMRGLVGSLNASVAGSILLYEAAAQRDPDGSRAGRRPTTRATHVANAAAVSDATADAHTAEADTADADTADADTTDAGETDAGETDAPPTETAAADQAGDPSDAPDAADGAPDPGDELLPGEPDPAGDTPADAVDGGGDEPRDDPDAV